MDRITLYVAIVLVGLGVMEGQPNYSIGLEPTDTVKFEVDTLFDATGLLDGYKTEIYTPVCEGDKCYAIKILFRWDILGRYVSYDTLPGEGLTKLDHIPFTPKDYQKLHGILADPKSVLASYQKEELVKDTRKSELDGFTGATVREVRDNVIEGGVYSCYTLWHLAHGRISENLRNRTRMLFNEPLVKKLVKTRDQKVFYFLIENFTEQQFEDYIGEVLQTISYGTGYFPKNAIEHMPQKALLVKDAQDFFAEYFDQLGYFTQVALLEKLQGQKLSEPLVITFKNSLADRNSYRDDLIGQLLELNQ